MERALNNTGGHRGPLGTLDMVGSGLHQLIRRHAFRLGDGVLLLLTLALADSAFVLAHVLYKLTPSLADAAFALDTERGYPELFQYLKFSAVVVMVGTLWWKTREPVYGAWMLLFVYTLCDDAFQLHERLGVLVATRWHFTGALGLRARDFGELIVTGVVGAGLTALIFAVYLRSGRRARDDSRGLAILIAGLVFFGVVVDMLHVAADGSGRAVTGGALGIVEDGGEMFVVSLLCWYVSSRLPHRRIANHRAVRSHDRSLARGAPRAQNISRHV